MHAHEMQREVLRGAERSGGGDRSVFDEQSVSVDRRGRMALRQLLGQQPRGGRAPAVQEPGRSEQERTDADAGYWEATTRGAAHRLNLGVQRVEPAVEVLAGVQV